MPFFEWTDQFSVKIQEMDEQHKGLVGMLNYLHDAKLDSKDASILGKVLDDLIFYTKTHFKSEEDLLAKHEFPGLAAHKAEHNSLFLKVDILRKKYYSGDKDIFTEAAILLNDWLAEHILIEDKKYGIYINKKE